MFDKLKQINQLREMKKKMDQMTIEEETGEIKIKMSGAMEVLSVEIGDKNNLRDSDIKDCYNKAVKTIQRKMAEQMNGLGMPF